MPNFQIRLDQKVFDEVIYNVTYWQLPADDFVTLTELADAIRADYVFSAVGILSASWSLEQLTVRQMDGGGPFTVPIPFTLGTLPGTNGGPVMPLFNSLLISTSFSGPKPNRGRFYMGGLTEGANSALGDWSGTDAATLATMVRGWSTGVALTAGTAFLRIARPDFLLNTWTLNNPVETVIGRTRTATMRSRRPS